MASATMPRPLPVGVAAPERMRTPVFLARLLRGLLAKVGAVVVLALVVAATLAPSLAPYDPTEQALDRMLELPGRQHLLGTDDLGRDLLSRLLYGARVSLVVGLLSVGISLVAGVGLRNAMLAIGIVGIPSFARLVRGQVLSLRAQEFVEAARAGGAGDGRIVLRHIVPGTLAPIIVHASLRVAFGVLAEAGLSFLGLGTQPPTPSWGAMLNTGREYLEMAPWLSIAPGAAIFLTTLSFNFLGDGLRDAADPRLRS